MQKKNMWTFEKENESTKKNKTNKMYLRLLIRRYLQKVVRFLGLNYLLQLSILVFTVFLILGCLIAVIQNHAQLLL